MNVAARLGAFGAGLAVTFVGALGVGAAVGPVDGGDARPGHGGHPGEEGAVPRSPGGLLVNDRGYGLELLTPVVDPGRRAVLALRVVDSSGGAVTAFDELHERRMHLIVVDRQLGSFQHVHPTMDAAGVWSVDVVLADPGTYRVFTDISPTGLGEALTLGADLVVPGAVEARAVAVPTATSTVDGYTVTLDGAVSAGSTSEVTLTVARDGVPVTDLDPYLGAYGHLVAIRAGDLAYLHVHPTGEPGDGSTRPGPAIGFGVATPGPGTYRMFLDFRHDGVVRTADFTVLVPPAGTGGGDAGDVHGTGSGGTDGTVDVTVGHGGGH